MKIKEIVEQEIYKILSANEIKMNEIESIGILVSMETEGTRIRVEKTDKHIYTGNEYSFDTNSKKQAVKAIDEFFKENQQNILPLGEVEPEGRTVDDDA